MFEENLEGYRPYRWNDWNPWWNGLDWEEAREVVDRESRARILLLGLVNAGKSTLLNRLRGCTLSPPTPGIEAPEEARAGGGCRVEDFGLFCLVDLPEEATGEGAEEDFLAYGLSPLQMAEEADLLVYLLDGAAGVRVADYRWIGRLRRLGRPLLVALNKSDLVEEEIFAQLPELEKRLATSVLPISALDGTNVLDRLLPRMVDASPGLAVPLGRELHGFRRQAAARLIRRAALFNGFIALEPVPFLDIPFQMATLVGMVMRIGAVYDRPPTDAHRREVIAAVTGGLLGRYATQQAIKLIPFVGWLISSFIAVSCTWLLGRAAVAYFEAGGDVILTEGWDRVRNRLHRHRQPPEATRRWTADAWAGLRRRWQNLFRPARGSDEQTPLPTDEERPR